MNFINNLRFSGFISIAAIMALVLASCSSKEEHFAIANCVDTNFDSVFNQMLNDTFYFPKVFGEMDLAFDEQHNAYSSRYIRKGKQFRNRVWDLTIYLKDSTYNDFGLSESQLEAFDDFHDNHLGDDYKLGEQENCLNGYYIEFRFQTPRVFAKNFGNWYLIIDYVIIDKFLEDFVDFNSYKDLYNLNNFQDFAHVSRGNFYSYRNASCDSITLNYPVIFKWNNQKRNWELRNSKVMFESDIKELGFKTVPMN